MVRRVCVVTFNRADYAPLRPLLAKLTARQELQTGVVVSGAHMAPEFGASVDAVAADGWHVDARVEMLMASDSGVGMAKSFALGVAGLAQALDGIAPDILVVFGDRYEMLAAGVAAALLRIPIAHIAGGQVTSGVIDDCIRHALSKLAHLHFTSTEASSRRLVQLGEDPRHIWTVGALGVDNLLSVSRMSREDLERDLGILLRRPTILVTYHPAPHGGVSVQDGVAALLGALNRFPEATVVFTHPNPDAGGRTVAAAIEGWLAARTGHGAAFPSLGPQRYPSLLASADAIIGNSSSGLIEAPALGVPTVNVGVRQDGRPRATSVIDVREDAEAIASAISKALSPEFRAHADDLRSPFGDGEAASRIAEVLATVDLDEVLLKRFVDLSGASIDTALEAHPPDPSAKKSHFQS